MYPDSNPVCTENAGLVKILAPVDLAIRDRHASSVLPDLEAFGFCHPRSMAVTGQWGSSGRVKIPEFPVPVFGDGNKQAPFLVGAVKVWHCGYRLEMFQKPPPFSKFACVFEEEAGPLHMKRNPWVRGARGTTAATFRLGDNARNTVWDN